jgi:hypothetical protein
MGSNEWTVLYDASRATPSGLLFPVVGLVLTGIAVFGLRLRHFERDDRGETRQVIGSRNARRFFWFSLVWTVLAAGMTLVPHVLLVRALRTGHFATVEGRVEQFVGANLLAKTPEQWSVAGHTYRFYDARSHGGFDSPGFIQPGMEVRIADVGGAIARLEVHR